MIFKFFLLTYNFSILYIYIFLDFNILDLTDPRSKLSETILAIFEETSKQVLDTLVNEFKLFQHFQGLRRYILLGQGDFVNYYMELVE